MRQKGRDCAIGRRALDNKLVFALVNSTPAYSYKEYESLLKFFMKGFLHDHRSSFGRRAAGSDHPGFPATADPGKSAEACRQAQRTAEVSLSPSLLLLRKTRRIAGSFFKGNQ